jgi:hypothetical protein
MLSRVDLPQPEWPMIETYSPRSITSRTSCSTSVVPALEADPPRLKVWPTASIVR